MVPKLLFDIAKCYNFCDLLKECNTSHSCDDIINFQRICGNAKSFCDFQLPEPWSGDIINAPILVISSNPAYSSCELYPTLDWPDPMIADFFINRFKNRGRYSWVLNNRVLNKDGSRSNPVRYWSSIQKRVEEILGRTAKPGIDYCITELVHCKSSNEKGVKKALPVCAENFCCDILKITGAKLIIVIGSIAKNYIKANCISPNGIPMIYLPHPNARGKKKVSDYYSEEEIENLRELLNGKSQYKNKFSNIWCPDVNLQSPIKYANVKLPTDEEVKIFIEEKIKEYTECLR